MTPEETSTAKQIVDQWFWQPAEGHNYHYRGALRTLVRFFESAPMEPDVMRLVIEYLRDEEIEGGISLLNKFVDLGAGWKAMDAWYRTDETEKWNGTDSRKVRVYQVLVQRPDSGDAVAGPIQTENGCQYTVTHEFHWNVESLPTPPASSSGVNYTLEGVVRDQETGLYSCVVVRRERVRQDIAEYTSAKTLYQDTKEEQHLGVKQGQSAGKSASVGGGTVVERSVTKNPDCTIDVHNVTTVDKPVSDAAMSKSETIFETRTTTEDRNQASAASMSLTPGKSVRTEKTQSGLHNNTVTQTVEKPVSDAVVEFARTLHGTQKSVTHRNQPTPITDVGMKVGERRVTRKTEGGKNDNTIVTQVVKPAGNVARSERKTVFENSASVRENVAADGELPEREADEAGNGATHSVDMQLNDDGTADIVTNDTTEKAKPGARKTKRKTLRGVVETTTDRNVTDGSAEVTNIGDSVEVEMTPGGRFNRTTTRVTSEPVGEIASGCEQTVFEHRHQKLSNVAAKPAVEAPSAGGGRTHRKDVRQTEEGTFDVTETTTTEKPVVEAEVTKTRTLHGLRTRTLNRNQPSSAPDPQNIGDSVTNRKTNGGLTDVVKETFTAQPAGKTLDAEEENRHSRTVESVRNRQEMEAPTVTFSDGKVERKSSRLLEDGTADVGVRTVTAKPSTKTDSWYDRYGTYTRCVYRNQRTPLLPSTAAADTRTSASFQMNDFGLYDGYWTKSGPPPAGIDGGDDQSNFTKTMTRTEERIVSSARDGTARKEWYQERKWQRVMRYNTGNGWALNAMNDIAQHPGGSGLYMSRITGRCMWEYFIPDGEWSETKVRTIQ